MVAVESIFHPRVAPKPTPSVEVTIDTVGVEVLDDALCLCADADIEETPANGDPVIPFASTLEHVG